MPIKYRVINGTKDDHKVVNESFSLHIARADAVRFNQAYSNTDYRVLAVDAEGTSWLEYEYYKVPNTKEETE